MRDKPAVLTHERKQFLKDRLQRITSQHRVFGYPSPPPVKLPKTTKIFEAEVEIKRLTRRLNSLQKIIKGYDLRCKNATKTRDDRKRAMRDECERAILFGTPTDAMKLLDKFERTTF